MTAKTQDQDLYRAVLESLITHIPAFKPVASMSDWERGSRNAFKDVFPQIRIYGCLFHYTQCIWAKVQKFGLTNGFKSNPGISKFTRLLMALPFLSATVIFPTFNLIAAPCLDGSEALMVGKLKKYIKKYWLTHFSQEELSIFELSISTNNGAKATTPNSKLEFGLLIQE